MLFPLSDPNGSELLSSTSQSLLTQFQGDIAERLNIEQMFVLIDGVLPFEACLYYQVLPLFIEGSRLHLGMVSSNDAGAVDYVRRIVSYHHYSLISRSISSEALQAALSAYLNYSGKKQKLKDPPVSKDPIHRPPGRSRTEQPVDRSVLETLVVDSPEELNGEGFSSADARTNLNTASDGGISQILSAAVAPPQEVVTPPDEAVAPSDEAVAPPADAGRPQEMSPPSAPVPNPVSPASPPPEGVDTPTVPQPPVAKPAASPVPSSSPGVEPLQPMAGQPSIVRVPPALHLSAKHIHSPIETLQSLPPNELVQELLARVLTSGIGRLYFERQATVGRVLWSQSGEVRSVIDSLNLPVFQGVINALKQLTKTPLMPSQQPRHIELERTYQGARLLLRFRFMPGTHGEEATLQVLRGAALRFYQQQKLSKLERDALTIARQLQNKVNEIRDRARAEMGETYTSSEVLPSLSQLLHTIEEQIGAIQHHGHGEDKEVSE